MSEKKSKPNILFIFTDQMHKFALGCMGNKDVITPNLDKLAKEGVLFQNSYSNCPICTPFRINLFTGLYTSQTGTFRNQARIPKSCVTLADVFNDGGYNTSFIGKWHIGNNGNGPIPKKLRGGFTNFIGYQCYNGFYRDVNFYDENNEEHHFDKHRTDVTTDIAIERLEKMSNSEDPFFMVVGYQAPHYPVQPSKEFDDMYKGKSITRRPNIKEIDPYTPTHSPRSARPRENCSDFQRYGNNLDEYIRLYYGMVSQVDANIGKLLKTLDRLGKRENTIIIFTSDHGDMQGSHFGEKNKTKPYEESSGIPLIVNVPNGAKGIVSDALIEGIDYFPTCIDYAGLKTDFNLPGTSFAPLTLGKTQEIDKPVFSEMILWKMVRYRDFKLVLRGPRYVPSELYNLKEDPYEMKNLIEDETCKEKKEELYDIINKWMKFTKKNKVKKWKKWF